MKIFALSLIIFSSMAQALEIPDSVVWVCNLRKNSIRTIRIDHNATTCSAIYTKGGQDQLMSKTSNREACELVGENIRSNLEKANWQCKLVEKTNFKTTSEVQ